MNLTLAIKSELYFTYESRNTLKSFALSITVKTIAKLNPEHNEKFIVIVATGGKLRSPRVDKLFYLHQDLRMPVA